MEIQCHILRTDHNRPKQRGVYAEELRIQTSTILQVGIVVSILCCRAGVCSSKPGGAREKRYFYT